MNSVIATGGIVFLFMLVFLMGYSLGFKRISARYSQRDNDSDNASDNEMDVEAYESEQSGQAAGQHGRVNRQATAPVPGERRQAKTQLQSAAGQEQPLAARHYNYPTGAGATRLASNQQAHHQQQPGQPGQSHQQQPGQSGQSAATPPAARKRAQG